MLSTTNNILFLYEYFKALKISVHTDPHEVKFNNLNYVFESSSNTKTHHRVKYKHDNKIQEILITQTHFKAILKDVALYEHTLLGKIKLN